MKKILFCLLMLGTSYLFGFSMSVDNGFVSLGNIAPGQSEYDAGFDYSVSTVVRVTIDPTAAGSLQVQANDFTGPSTLYISNLKWQLSYIGAGLSGAPWYIDSSVGVHYDGSLASNLRTKAFTAAGINDTAYTYMANSSSGGVPYSGGFQCQFLWHINVPETQQAGTYFTNVLFTLTGN